MKKFRCFQSDLLILLVSSCFRVWIYCERDVHGWRGFLKCFEKCRLIKLFLLLFEWCCKSDLTITSTIRMFSGKGYYTGKGAVDYVKPTYHGHGKYLAHKVKLYFEDERHRTDRSFSFMCDLKLTMHVLVPSEIHRSKCQRHRQRHRYI
jgi:hypothetical protein